MPNRPMMMGKRMDESGTDTDMMLRYGGNGDPAPAFDPEGKDYDMDSAVAAGLKADETGHWPSRDPKTGLLLKGRGHETFGKTLEGEKAAGMSVYKGKDGRWYSRHKNAFEAVKDSLRYTKGTDTEVEHRERFSEK